VITPKDFPALGREKLLALAAELQHQIAELRASPEEVPEAIPGDDDVMLTDRREAIAMPRHSLASPS
jgi:hypothetical protein